MRCFGGKDLGTEGEANPSSSRVSAENPKGTLLLLFPKPAKSFVLRDFFLCIVRIVLAEL